MKTPTYLKEVSAEALAQAAAEARRFTQETLKEIPRIVISAEERLRQQVRSTLRLIVAALFFLIGNVVSLGMNVSIALAKKSGTEQPREKRTKLQQKSKPKAAKVKSSKMKLKTLSHLHDRKPAKKVAKSKIKQQVGKASWYGKPFHNRRTASGKRYDMYAPMAAHRTLPFGTICKITNLANGKSCIVEIADRGPYIGNRIIDLSYATANELEFASKGIAEVQLDVLGNVEPEFNFAEHVRQPIPQFDVMPQFPQRRLLELKDMTHSAPIVMDGREN